MKRSIASPFLCLFTIFSINVIAQQPVPDYSKQKVLHLVSTAHFDTQWKWTEQTSINNYLLNTLDDNFNLIEKYPDYVFNFEGAVRYMWVKEYYPNRYNKLKEYIAKGRWNIAGSSLDAGDVNMPSPEALIRNFLLGQQFYKKEFGKTSTDVYLPDCFGFPYSLPSIAAHCGLNSFSTIKLHGNSAVGMPFDIGMWQGPDGSKILAEINPGSVSARITRDASTDTSNLLTINNLGNKTGIYAAYKLYGTGDRGGAPDDQSVALLEKSLKGNGPVKVIAASTDLLGNQLTQQQKDQLTVYNGEFILSKHGTGCYTSQALMKLLNRKNELLADATERAAVAANWLGGAPYPKEKINEAWTRFLRHEFHDDLTGTSIPEVYEFSWNDEFVSRNQFNSVLNTAAGAVSRGLDTRTKGIPLTVYNALSVQREDVVEATVNLSANTKSVIVFNKDGKEVPSQIINNDGSQYHILFLAKLPANGFEVYDVRESDQTDAQKSSLTISDRSLENARYKVTIDKNGDISSVFDKRYKKEILSAPMRIEFLNDVSVDWPQWEVQYKAIKAAPRNYVSGIKSISIEENGPVRVSLKIVRETEGSTFTQYIRLANGEAGNRVDVVNDVDWHSKNTLLKASFPLSVSNQKATYDLGLGTIQRNTNTEKMYEVPAQQWADLSSSKGDYGITIMNDCKYGWDKPDDHTLRLTLFHNPEPAARYPTSAFQDFGRHQFTYSIAGHAGDWKNETTLWQPAFLNQPVVPFETTRHEGQLGKSLSLASLNTKQVAIRAIKQAENTNEIVVRLQELTGSLVKNVSLSMASKIMSAREINGVEDEVGSATIKDGKLLVDMNPYQPRTFAVTIAKPSTALTTTQSLPVDLKYTTEITSPDVDRTAGAGSDFDGKGHTIPSELWPDQINSDGVIFKMGPRKLGPNVAARDAIICQNDTIALPAGNYKRLYILAAATEDTRGDFKVDGKTYHIGIQYFSGFIGQGQELTFKNKFKPADPAISKAYLKTDNIAWMASHRHDVSGINEAYVYCYLYKYAIDIAPGAKTLILPNNDKIRVVAVTLANDDNANTHLIAGMK
ncbi:MAG TPA: glycoside hydrolase family 38 C-terminal domain-containing protein [Mucilaginibacter sp.]|jgi:alpha-mannosidase|nr:glycoside hydrolase family 38 C-terminal domain-containing protein [Mucilaginibacter sp.]